MSELVLHAYKHSDKLNKILAVAKAANVTLKVVEEENKLAPRLTVEASPTNTFPYLITPDGIISEAFAIMFYLGSKAGLSGTNDHQRS